LASSGLTYSQPSLMIIFLPSVVEYWAVASFT